MAEVETDFLPYGRQAVDEDDIRRVCRVLRSDFLTTGPGIEAFEKKMADFCGTAHAVAVNSGTAALHCAMAAAGIQAADEVIVPPMTFAATANSVVYQGGTPVFADVCRDTLLLDPDAVEKRITPQTRAVVAVDYAGQMCDYDRLRELARRHGLVLISDACHALGADLNGRMAGQCADMTVFSFHPVKHITTGEGGMVVTDDRGFAETMRRFRNHGISMDAGRRHEEQDWFYEISQPGFNYRITDFQCALGGSQLEKLPGWIDRRRRLAGQYNDFFKGVDNMSPLGRQSGANHAFHLYVIRLTGALEGKRKDLFRLLRKAGVGVNVHYIPVHYHPFYRNRFGTGKGLCPEAEAAYEQILTLPLFPAMTDRDMQRVCTAVQDAAKRL